MITIGLAARLATEKGVEYLFEAIAGIDCKLLIAGPLNPVGENKYKDRIFELVEKVKDKVVFLGAINHQNMKDFYKKIDILVLPSINSTESFGIVQVEAMICGVPVIASDLPGVRVPIKTTGYGLLFKPGDSEGLTRAIIEVSKNTKAYKPDPRQVLKIFDLQKVVSFYESLVR